jgi:hypothetical protein
MVALSSEQTSLILLLAGNAVATICYGSHDQADAFLASLIYRKACFHAAEAKKM